MSLRIRINQKIDNKLIQNFPIDPYADLHITTQHTTLQLSTAYLAIDSTTFAELPPSTTTYDLSQFHQDCAIAVLRSLYGGCLQCSCVSELEDIWPIIEHLGIQQYKLNIQKAVKQWLQKKQGGLGVLQWIDCCIKLKIMRQWIVQWLSQQKLKPLESTKNYLQLSKLNDSSLNFILLEYLQKQNQNDLTVNVILQNYFNRKGHNPNQYLLDADLAPLKAVWQKYHYRLKPKLEKTTSIQTFVSTTFASPFKYIHSPRTSLNIPKSHFNNNMNCASLNLAGDLPKRQNMPQSYLLDMKIADLSNELEQKARKVQILTEELRELRQLKAKKVTQQQVNNEQSMVDIALLKSRMKSRKEKHSQLQTSPNEYVFDNANKKVVEGEKNQKLKMVAKNSGTRP